MAAEPPPLEALEPQAASRVLTDPAATPVSAVRRRNARRSKPGRSRIRPVEVLQMLYRFVSLVGV